MINLSIVLSVAIGILVIAIIPDIIYAILWVVLYCLEASSYLYRKFREVVFDEELYIVMEVDSDKRWREWISEDIYVKHNVVEEGGHSSWKVPDYILISNNQGDNDD